MIDAMKDIESKAEASKKKKNVTMIYKVKKKQTRHAQLVVTG